MGVPQLLDGHLGPRLRRRQFRLGRCQLVYPLFRSRLRLGKLGKSFFDLVEAVMEALDIPPRDLAFGALVKHGEAPHQHLSQTGAYLFAFQLQELFQNLT